MNDITEKTLRTPEGPIAYAEGGPEGGGAEVLLLIHGGFGAANHWLRNQSFFSRRYRTLALDLPGFGGSYLPPKPHDAGVLIAGIDRFLDGLEIDACHCAAFSFGGTIAVQYCQRNAGRFRRLALLGPGGFGIGTDVPLAGERRTARGMSPEERREVFIHNQKAIMFKDPAMVDEKYLHFAEANLARSRLNILPLNREPYLPDFLPAASMPLLLLWGDSDAAAHPSLEARRAACLAAAPHAESALIENAGHMAQWERPDAFNERVLRFLAG